MTAPVMVPGAKDCDYDNGEPPLTASQIHAFKESYDSYAFVDHEHKLTKPKPSGQSFIDANFNGKKIGVPSDSIILDQDTTFTLYDGTSKTYPTGTWLLTTHITDEEAISEAMKGYYTGYSPSILPRANADKYLEALKTKKQCACKNVSSMGNSLIKDIPDPVVLSVSLTRQPCLHESKFCEVNNMEEEMSLKSKILTAMGMSEEAEVIALKSQVTTLEEKIDAMQTEFKEALKAQQEEFKQTLTEALKTAVEEEVVEEEPETTEEPAEVEVEEEVEEPEADKAEEVEVEEEPVAEKGESKQEPVHDNLEAQKSKPKTVYELMGRYPNGVKIRK
jgi:hypothetical protein